MTTDPSADSNEVTVNIKGPSELKLSITISLKKSVKDLKVAISEKTDVGADRQRLIYSGRVLKDEDELSTYKIQSGHTVHMVKGAARTGGDAQPAAAQPLPTMQAGQNPSDPLTQLNSARAHGLMAGFNPFEGTGVNTNDPNLMQGMLESPQFLQQMSSMMSNPALMEQLISSDPNMAHMAPQLRAMFSNPQFQSMIQNPDSLRQMMQMSSQLRQAGFNPGAGGFGGFPPFGGFGGPGSPPAATEGSNESSGQPNLFAQAAQAGTGGGAGAGAGTGGAPPNPFSMFGGLGGFGGPGSPGAAGQAGATPGSPNQGAGAPPFGMVDPALLQQMFGGAGGFGGFPGAGSPPPPTDSRPPEERFQSQLQQLNDMGFTNASQNVRALLATNGNVSAAIEYILGGGGL